MKPAMPMISLVAAAVVLILLDSPALHAETAAPTSPTKSAKDDAFIEKAEALFYQTRTNERMGELQTMLDQRIKENPKDVYALWARSRVAYFRKEHLHFQERYEKDSKTSTLDKKFALIKECHEYADLCIEADSENAECHLVKGACYASEVSTLGPTLKALPKLKKMDLEWVEAEKLPSTFMHIKKNMPTAVMAKVLRGVLYRLIPDKWWFGLIAGVRGDKNKAFDWIRSGVIGKLDNEPMFVLEVAAITLCKAKRDEDAELTADGLQWIEKGLKLPIRHPMDDYDRKNMEYIKAHPKEACNYRRERFEDAESQLQSISNAAAAESSPKTSVSGK